MHMPILVLLVAMTTMILGLMNNKKYTSALDRPLPSAHVTGIQGKKVSLPCDTQSLTAQDKVDMVLWFRETDGEPIYSYDIRGRSISQPKLSSSPSGFGTRAYFRATSTPATLLLENVTPADSGVYRCRVDFQNSPTRNFRVNLTVITPPNRPTIVDARTRDSTRLLEPYNEGDSIELLCEVHGGIPRPRLIWYLENTIIDETYEQRDDGVTNNALTFPMVGRQHLNARLICQASNTNLAPPLSKLLILDINLRPLSVQIVKKQGPLSADRSYEVECIVTGSRPPAEITWWKGSKPLRKNVKIFSGSNSTRSVVQLVPEAQDHETKLICRAENPHLRASSLEDTWKLAVQYVPIVSLKMSSNMNTFHIAEGDDVYFECSARANPSPSKFLWFKQGMEIVHNISAGVLLSKQSLVLQNVHRNDSGEYSCAAQNDEGVATSNPVNLQVRYPPVCVSSESGQVFVVLEKESIELICEVDSSPPPDHFMWSFNNSKEYMDIDPKYYKSVGSSSTFLYTPSAEDDFGVVTCFALNTAGQQNEPCKFILVPATLPTSLHNCSVLNQSVTGLHVECQEGFDGGLIQEFHMEVLELPSMIVLSNVTSNISVLTVTGLPARARAHYLLNLYASNAKGRSEISTLYTIISPNRYTESYSPISLSPMLGSIVAIGALLTASVCAVLAAAYRRHMTSGKPSNNSVDSLPERDDTYTASPKIDYSSQFELKLDPDDDPDFISIRYGNEIEEIKTRVDESDALRTYGNRGFNSAPSNYNISVVDRGVTARSADIAASRGSDVRESCI